MLTFNQYLRETREIRPLRYSSSPTLGMPLRDFIDALQVLDAQEPEVERTVEIGLSWPEPYSISVTFSPQDDAKDSTTETEQEETGE